MNKVKVLLVTLLLIVGINTVNIVALFTVTATTETVNVVEGVTHTKIVGTVENEQGEVTNQVINILEGNPVNNDNLHVIVGDGYPVESYGTADLQEIIAATNARFPNYDIVAGVNADYFNAVKGISVEAYVRDFVTVSEGLGYERPLIGFKDNGNVIFGRPEFEGMELLIYNQAGELKNTVPVEKINGLPYSETGTSVFFPDYEGTVSSSLEKIVLDTTDFKTDGYKTRYYGAGTFNQITTDEMPLPDGQFMIVSLNKYVTDLIDENDEVVIQRKIVGDFAEARFVVGCWELLIENGVAVDYMKDGTWPEYPSPRTAVGVKADGTVVMVTVDGRQSEDGMDGLNLYEMADLLVDRGCVTAYALDGGGSTTVAVKNNSDTYTIHNSPSDGHLRKVSNAIFFVTGSHNPIPTELPLPDLSEKLQLPSNIYIDDTNTLRFDKVNNVDGYLIKVNDQEIETNSRTLPLNLAPGEYQIQIKAIGDGLLFSDSDYSEIIYFTVYSDTMEELISLFTSFAKNESK